MRYDKPDQRPDDWEMDFDHPLATGLVFAGLGRFPKSNKYVDSSPYGNHGVLTNMSPADDWAWDSTLNRFVVSLDGADAYIDVSLPQYTYPFSFGGWVSDLDVGDYVLSYSKSGENLYFHDIYSDYSGGWKWSIQHRNTAVNSEISTKAFVAGEWVHVVYLGISDTDCRLLVNGILVATETASLATSGLENQLLIGKANTPSSLYARMKAADVFFANRALSLAEIQQLADPSNVMLSGLLLPPKRRLWGVSGGAVTTTINCTAGAITLTDYNASISVGTTIGCTCGAVAIADYAAAISVGTTISCTADAIVLADYAAAISVGTTISCTADAITIAGYATAISQGTTIACTAGAVTLASYAATITNGLTIACTCGAITIADYAVSISVGTTISCTVDALVVAGLAATVDLGLTVDCTVGAIVVADYAAAISVGTTIDCTVGAVVIAGRNPTIDLTATTTIDCTLGAIVLAALNATVVQGATITLSTAALVIAGLNVSIPQYQADGLDYMTGDRRLHYSVPNLRTQYSVKDNRPHYGV